MAKQEFEYKTGKHGGQHMTYLSGKSKGAKTEALKRKLKDFSSKMKKEVKK